MEVTHIFRDGTVTNDITGMFVPYNDNTKHIYETLARVAISEAKRKKRAARQTAEKK